MSEVPLYRVFNTLQAETGAGGGEGRRGNPHDLIGKEFQGETFWQ